MPTPVLVVLAGPNGAGKTTLFERVLAPVMHLEFVNVDRRYGRLWEHLRLAVAVADDAWVYDNSRAASPLRVVAQFVLGQLVAAPTWPAWMSSRLDLPGRTAVQSAGRRDTHLSRGRSGLGVMPTLPIRSHRFLGLPALVCAVAECGRDDCTS